MTPDEAYEEALRRIQEAEESGALELDLSGWNQTEEEYIGLEELARLPPELERLTSLQSLNLFGCEQLSGDLSQLAGLTALKRLDISGCRQLSGDLSTLANLTSLQSLDISGYHNLSGNLSPLASLTSLQSLNLDGCWQLSGDLSPLARLTKLQSLDLCRCLQLRGDLSPLAGLTSLQSLNLSECNQLSGDLSPLTGLISLRSLDLSSCLKLSGDLSPLAGLTSLQELDLSKCWLLSDLSPLAGLPSLQSLYLDRCTEVRKFAPLERLLPQLQTLSLYECRFDDLPSEVCGQELLHNVIREVRAHFADLRSGQSRDAELKIFILGNGGVGKTQLSRRLQDLDFDPEIPTTHGIKLNFVKTSVNLEHFKGSVRLNLWDFGGQEIYHGSHTLFLHSQAIFLLVWTPEEEKTAGKKTDSEHRPITYWLDYLRAIAGTDNPLIIVQSQCDTPENRADVSVRLADWIGSSWTVEASAKTDFGLDRLKATLKDAAWACLHKRPPPPIGKGRLKVRDRLRQMLKEDQERVSAQRRHRLLERANFDRICDEVGGISDKEALLDFLHHNGVVFYRPGLFQNQIILDQNWALEAIYAIFNRDKCFKQLKKLHGRFSREDLELLIWSGYTHDEQNAFLGMMESCSICFKVRELSDVEWEYIAPELLPEWSDAQELLLAGRIPKDHPMAEAEARYAFLHEGVLRGYLSKIGQQAGDAALYWKYGCWSYEGTTDSRVLIESQWDDTESEAGAGSIRLRAWGENAERLIDPLLEALESLPMGQRPEIKRTVSAKAKIQSSASVTVRLVSASPVPRPPDIVDRPTQIKLEDLIFAPDPFMKDFFVSYTKTDKAWAEWIAWTLEAAGYSTVLQAWDFLPGSNFVLEMQRAATEANRTIAVLSQRYLESSFTQPEWAAAFAQDPQGKTRKLIPVRIAPCELTGILAPIVYLDLVDLPENDARKALLGAFIPTRNKPPVPPVFPGGATQEVPGAAPAKPFPAEGQTTSSPITQSLENLVSSTQQNRQASKLSPDERLALIRQLNAMLSQHFNMLVVTLNPEPGLIPEMPAPQADRSVALVKWAEAPGGRGLSVLQKLLDTIVNPQ